MMAAKDSEVVQMRANITFKTTEEKDRAILAWKNKTDQAKKGEVLREIQKLKVQIQSFEREKSTHIYSKRSDFRKDFSQLEEMESKFNTDRSTEKVRLQQQLEKIGHMVKRFHKELRDIQPTPEFLEKLKMIMEDIEGTINLFKEQQRKNYEELMREERTTFQEIQALEKKFDTWSQMSGSSLPKKTPKNQTLASARDITKDLPPEVASFEKFMEQNGGIRGGWDEYDHQTFLKFRLRYQGKAVFIKHLLPAIPTKTEEEIQQHEDWYQEYLFLNDTKKDAIKKWREKREAEKEDILANVEEEPVDQDIKQQKLQEIIEEERRERKSKLNSWRFQKELEKAQAEEKRLREQLMKAKKEEEWKQKQIELKAKVDEYKKEKQGEEEFLKRQQEEWEREELERQRQISAREIVRFRERDEKALQEKLAKEKAKQEEEKEREKRLERLKSQVEIEVDRDPNRLLQPTAGWKERTKDIGPSGTGQVLHMPHRAVPAWRQNLH